jgi:hypothetical protein
MHRDLVGERSWISEADYKEGLALAQLALAHWLRNWQSIWAMFITGLWARRWSALPLWCRLS